MIEFGKPKKLLCEMGEKSRRKFISKDKMFKPKVKNPRKGRPLAMVTYNGETRPVREWAKLHGIMATTLRKRILWGWSEEELFKPVRSVSSLEEIDRKILEMKIIRLNKDRESLENKNRIKNAILKVLEMRKRRSEKIDAYLDYQESVDYAIARVLEMRKSRAKRLRHSWDMAA